MTFQPNQKEATPSHSRNHYTTPYPNKELNAPSEIKLQTNLSGKMTEWGNVDVSQTILQELFLVQPQQFTMSLHYRIEDSWMVTGFQNNHT